VKAEEKGRRAKRTEVNGEREKFAEEEG